MVSQCAAHLIVVRHMVTAGHHNQLENSCTSPSAVLRCPPYWWRDNQPMRHRKRAEWHLPSPYPCQILVFIDAANEQTLPAIAQFQSGSRTGWCCKTRHHRPARYRTPLLCKNMKNSRNKRHRSPCRPCGHHLPSAASFFFAKARHGTALKLGAQTAQHIAASSPACQNRRQRHRHENAENQHGASPTAAQRIKR